MRRLRPFVGVSLDREAWPTPKTLAASAARHLRTLRGRIVGAPWRRLVTIAGLMAVVALFVAGIALIYPPAGLIAGSLGLLALLTFDIDKVGRLTWPR